MPGEGGAVVEGHGLAQLRIETLENAHDYACRLGGTFAGQMCGQCGAGYAPSHQIRPKLLSLLRSAIIEGIDRLHHHRTPTHLDT